MPAFPDLPRRKYDDVRNEIRSGDLLFGSGNYALSKLIQKGTDSCWSHAALVLRLDALDRVMVLESVESSGVRTVALSEYVNNFENTRGGYDGRIAIGRHDKFAAAATRDAMKAMAQFAVDRFACPYDREEISRITSRILAKKLGFDARDMKRDDVYICSEYVHECYKRVGIDLEYGNLGFIGPGDVANAPGVRLLWEIEVTPAPQVAAPAQPNQDYVSD